MDTEYSTNHKNNQKYNSSRSRSRERHSSRRDRSRSRSRNRTRHSSRRDRSRSRERYSSRRDRSRSRSRNRHSSRRDRSRSSERNKQSEIEKLKLDIEIAKKTKELAEIKSSILSSQINTSDLIKSAINFRNTDNSFLPPPPSLPPPYLVPQSLALPFPPPLPLPPQPQFINDYTIKQLIPVSKNDEVYSYKDFLKEIDILFNNNSIIIGSKVPRKIWPLKLDGSNYKNLKELADDFGIKNEYRDNILFLIRDKCSNYYNCYNKSCKYTHSDGYIPRPSKRCIHRDKCIREINGTCNFSHPDDEYWSSCT